MQSVLTFFRFLALVLFLGIPFSLLGGGVSGKTGIAVGAALAVLIPVLAGFFSEWFVARTYRASREVPAGLLQSLRFSDPSAEVTRVAVFPDPFPNALVVRSWTGTGTIFLSRGLLVLLSESELRAVLRVCRGRMKRVDTVTRGIAAVLGSLLFFLAPRSWVQVLLGGQQLPAEARGQARPFSRRYSVIYFFAFLVVFPVASLILRMGGGVTARDPALTREMAGNPALQDAMRKIKGVAQSWPLIEHPALSILQFYPCLQRTSLLPLF